MEFFAMSVSILLIAASGVAMAASGGVPRATNCENQLPRVATSYRMFCFSAKDIAGTATGTQKIRTIPARYHDNSNKPVCDWDNDFNVRASCCPEPVTSLFLNSDTAYNPKVGVNPICTGQKCPRVDTKEVGYLDIERVCGPFIPPK